MAKVTKSNVIKGKGKRQGCKNIKGGRAACWIKVGGKTLFVFTTRKKAAQFGIAITGRKILPNFTGSSSKRSSLSGTRRRRRGTPKRRPTRSRRGCKTLSNGRRACHTSKGFRIVS